MDRQEIEEDFDFLAKEIMHNKAEMDYKQFVHDQQMKSQISAMQAQLKRFKKKILGEDEKEEI